jgi:hypothetical protein
MLCNQLLVDLYILCDAKIDSLNKLLAAYLNINSFRYKYCHIQERLVNNTVDVLFLAETKIDGTFCDAQFTVDNYHFWRKDPTTHEGLLTCHNSYHLYTYNYHILL